MAPVGGIRVLQFSQPQLTKELGKRLSVNYLYSYLKDLGAKSILVEDHYVDRHFLDSFANYYSRSFSVPDPHCRRLHFFNGITAKQLSTAISQSSRSKGELSRTEKRLQHQYLGFVVRRPLAGAPIGRTVLKTYPHAGRRRYSVVRSYTVNLACIRLRVDGLAFHEQDGGVGVCASASLWSALQRVAVVSGNRTPTPHEITAAAHSPFPGSDGLQDHGMAAALSNLGYLADYFVPCADNIGWFRTQVAVCLQSQLPVVLLLSAKASGEGHAVTVTGYSQPTSVKPVSTPEGHKFWPGGGSLDVVYVHDDNLGPYAHYELFERVEVDGNNEPRLMLRRGGTNANRRLRGWQVDNWIVDAALIPKPQKLRLPIESLVADMAWLQGVLQSALANLDVFVDARFETGVNYKRQMVGWDLDKGALPNVMRQLTLPRHVGVLSVRLKKRNQQRICDAVLDVSEVQRYKDRPTVLAFVAPGVPRNSQFGSFLNSLAKKCEAKFITA